MGNIINMLDSNGNIQATYRYNAYGYAPAYNKFLNYAGNLVLKANGQWARSTMYSFANAGISSLFSGWY